MKNLFLLPALIASLGLILASRVAAQTFTTLHSFDGDSNGGNPYAGLILSGDTLFGTTATGGGSGRGTVFAIHTDGTGFTNLHDFTGGSDGAYPDAGLILSGSTLYGTANAGGDVAGTVFKLNTDGTGFTTVHNFREGGYNSSFYFTNSDGVHPYGGLILSGDTLYGTAVDGGSSGFGTVFKLNTNGTDFTALHSFTAIGPAPSINSDGGWPYAGLVLSGNSLFGTAQIGGSSGNGTVFAVNTDGTDFTTLHSFSYSDGAPPSAGLILSGNKLYGTAYRSGGGGFGTVFAINTNGTGYTNIYSSNDSAGGDPSAELILSGNTLYGTAYSGGSSFNGTVFAIHTDGTGFTNLHSFKATDPSTGINSDGANPKAGLILSGNALYGTTAQGGSSGFGTVFRITLPGPPHLTIIRSAANVILTWPTTAAGFTLQSTTSLDVSAVWVTVSPAPVVVNGQNAVTNPISGIQQFYRLSQ